MKFTWFFGVCLMIIFRAEAQQDSTAIRDVFKSKRHLEISLNHGFMRPSIHPVSGPHEAYPLTGRVFDLGLGYTFNASENLGFTATGKLGAYPMLVGIPPTDYSYGQDTKQYFHWVSYTGFAELSGTATYRHFLSSRLAWASGGGVGVKFLVSTSSGAGMSSSLSDSHSYYRLENSGKAKPFLLLQTGFQYKLKNSDLLGLRLSYHHSLRPVQEGSYYIASNSPAFSQGTIRVQGHQLTVGLGYTFTGYEKLQRRMQAETPQNKRAFKRTLKREYYEQRMPKSSALRVYGAIFADQNTSTDKAGVIGSARPGSLGAGLEFHRAFHPHFFWEAGFNMHEYWEGNSYRYPGLIFSGSSSNAFEARQVSGGAGYILRNKNLVPLFYFSGGAALAYSPDYKGLSGHSYGRFETKTPPGYLEMYTENYMLRKVFPLLYTGVRKDFRIRGKLFFSPAFKYYQGLTKVYDQRVQYTTSQFFPEYRQSSVFMRGSYFEYSLGLKLDL
ncbi:hypothetical protein I5M27_04475 [Adhaeribacter sp. BT258]|uniref:Outer membrane protein beta-barrel domain-containing protein n=1 Tax=Adhaeribacter terrigena TaxID=2793070 RepID=A0ABS1BYK2_9BACT|nr:hypothetical protein [Adhaeribacter terrigena]MBK0402226.1 hypothetical protein [Adhaeribacter terrigena]